jgi:hypothetical protein
MFNYDWGGLYLKVKTEVNMSLRVYVIVISSLLGLSSCVTQNGVTHSNLSFPIGIRAKKKKIKPPKEFVDAIFDYQRENGHWPLSERDFETFATKNRRIFDNFYNSGFLSWRLGDHSLDFLEVYFVHEPVYVQTIGVLAFEGRDVKLKSTFIASTRVCKTAVD